MQCFILEHVHDIYSGLALEQFLFHTYISHSLQSSNSSNRQHTHLGDPVLLFWQSHSAVVIGRNQNLFYECNLNYINKHNITLARRDSGGGTVYHDEENINICIISPAHEKQVEKNLLSIKALLGKVGLNTELNKRNDLLLDGKKISGSAMRYRKKAMMHHFTLLLSPDIEKMKTVLQANHRDCMSTPNVESLPSDICATKLNYKQITTAFINNARVFAPMLYSNNEFGMNAVPVPLCTYIPNLSSLFHQQDQNSHQKNATSIFEQERTRLSSMEWVFLKNPSFTITLHFGENDLKALHRNSSVEPPLQVHCKKACIETIHDAKQKMLYDFNTTNEKNSTPIMLSKKGLKETIQKSEYDIIKLVVNRLLAMLFTLN